MTAIAAGWAHTVALKNDGTVLAWGYNEYGQTTIPEAAQSGVIAIAAGIMHTVALKSDGTVVAWGDNFMGQTTIPVGLSGVTAIAAGELHTVALKSDGSVVAWGYNSEGQTTIPDAAKSGVTAIAAGDYHTVVLVPTKSAPDKLQGLTLKVQPKWSTNQNDDLHPLTLLFDADVIINQEDNSTMSYVYERTSGTTASMIVAGEDGMNMQVIFEFTSPTTGAYTLYSSVGEVKETGEFSF